jgi:hypothetical protein
MSLFSIFVFAQRGRRGGNIIASERTIIYYSLLASLLLFKNHTQLSLTHLFTLLVTTLCPFLSINWIINSIAIAIPNPFLHLNRSSVAR